MSSNVLGAKFCVSGRVLKRRHIAAFGSFAPAATFVIAVFTRMLETF